MTLTRVTNAQLKDVITPQQFGAIGDGVADDTAAIQAALDSGAAVVNLPEGTYSVTSTLNIPLTAIQIVGSGRGTCTIQAGSAALTGALMKRSTGSSSNVVLADMTLDANGFGSHGLLFQHGAYCRFEGLDVKGATTTVVELGGAGQDVNSYQIENCDFDGQNVAAYALHIKAQALDGFVKFSNFKNATDACVLSEAGGVKFFDARTFGAGVNNIGFDINGTNNELYGCRAGNIDTVCYKIRKSNVVLLECEARWDSPITAAYAVDVASSLKNIRLSGRSVGGDDVQQIVFNGSYDRAIVVNWTQVVGSSTEPSTFSPSNVMEELLVGTFDTTLAGNSSDTEADNGSFLQAGTLAMAAYQSTPLTLHRTGNNGRLISLGRSGVTTGYIDTTTGKITLSATDTLELLAGSGSSVIVGDGVWNGSPIRLGTSRLWVDATGDLRIKTGSDPVSDTDGTVVGTQT